MSAELGLPAHEYAILGEGNTSVRADGDSFWIKASGTSLAGATRENFVRVSISPILAALDEPGLDDAALKQLLRAATVEGERAPSIETFLHALCLQLDGVRFVGHTHPAAAVGLLSGCRSRELFQGCLFPDQIVVLGPAMAYVPYADPGLPLALALRGPRRLSRSAAARAQGAADGEPRRDRLGEHGPGGAQYHADAGEDVPHPGRDVVGRWAAVPFPGTGRTDRQATGQDRAAARVCVRPVGPLFPVQKYERRRPPVPWH